MNRHLLLAALVAFIVVMGAQESAPIAADDPLTADEMCDLFPQDEGFRIGWTRGDACDARRGDCDGDVCMWGRILRFSSPQEARDVIGQGSPVQGLGEVAVHYVADSGEYWLYLQRGSYMAFVFSASGDTGTARALAEHVDRELERVLGTAVPSDDDADAPPDASDDTDEAPAGELDIAGVFFGTENARALLPRIAEIMQCPYLGLQYQESPAENCPGLLDALGAAGDYRAGFFEGFPNPSQLERDLSDQVQSAIILAGLTAKGGQPLFPSLGPALEVIAKLADKRTLYTLPGQDPVSVVERFVGLLAARDAAQWETRFP